MKKKILVAALLFTLLITGCGKGKDSKYNGYKEVLDNYLAYFQGDSDADVAGSREIDDVIDVYGKSYAYSAFGYKVKDITGDGVDELIIMEGDEMDGVVTGYLVVAVYTMKDGKPVATVAPDRESLFFTGENSLYSSGLDEETEYIFFDSFSLSNDGTEKLYDYFYFSGIENAGNEDELPNGEFYMNTTGEFDIDSSEKVDLSEDDYIDIVGEEYDKLQFIEMVPMADYEASGSIEGAGSGNDESKEAADCPITVESAEKYKDVETEFLYFEFIEKYGCIVLLGREGLKDFKVLDLEYVKKDVYKILRTLDTDETKYDFPLYIEIENVPKKARVGFSYIDNSGVTKYYAISGQGRNKYKVIEFTPESN